LSAESASEGSRVLVVDDEPHIRTACAEALERSGYEVLLAEDGATASAAIESGRLDAAVLDIVLPDTDGLTLLKAVRARNCEAVVVLVTGFASLDTAMEAVRLGAYEYMRKPFAAGDLVRIIDRGLEQQQMRNRDSALVEDLRASNRDLLERQEQLEERMQLASDELEAFAELGQQLSGSQSLPDTMSSILEAGRRLTHARSAAVYRVDGHPRRFRGVAASGMATRDVTEADLPLGRGLLGAVVREGEARIENDALAGEVADDEYLGYLGVQSLLAAPLHRDDEVGGVLVFFDHAQNDFTEHSLNLVGVLASQVARVVATMDLPEAEHAPSASSDGFVDMADLL